jgi:hypothetical protein
MLEFLVLGQIPGTQIVITFQWVLIVASLGFGVLLGRRIAKQSHNGNAQVVEDITL